MFANRTRTTLSRALLAARPPVMLATLTAQRRAVRATALAALSTLRPMSAQCFQRLRQFALFKFAILVRVEFIQQVFCHLFRTWALMLLSTLSAGAAALSPAAKAAALTAGLLGVDRQRCQHDCCDCDFFLHGVAPFVGLCCHTVHARKIAGGALSFDVVAKGNL